MADPERVKGLNNERPSFRPSMVVWDCCIKFAEEYGISPSEVLEKFVMDGMCLAILDKKHEGQIIYRKTADHSEVEIRVYRPNTHQVK